MNGVLLASLSGEVLSPLNRAKTFKLMLQEFTKSAVLFVGEARGPVVPAGLLSLELAIDLEAFGVGGGRTAGSSTGLDSIAEGDGGTVPGKSPCAVLVDYWATHLWVVM